MPKNAGAVNAGPEIDGSDGGVNAFKLIAVDQGPDLQNILRQSYDYLTIMPKLRSTYDRRLIQKNILRRTQGFSQVQFTCKIVRSSEIVFVN